MPKRRRLLSLTAEQQARLPVIRDKWIAIGLSTEPADRSRAEAAIRVAYRRAGLQEPAITIWLESPRAGAVGVEYVYALRSLIGDDRRDRARVEANVRARGLSSVGASVLADVGERMWASVRARELANVSQELWDSVWPYMGNSLWQYTADSVWGNIWANVEERVWESVWENVWESVATNVQSVRAALEPSIEESVGTRIWQRSVGTNVLPRARASLGSGSANVGGTVWGDLRVLLWDRVLEFVRYRPEFAYGQHDANWTGWIDAFTQFGLGDLTAPADGLTALCESCGWYWPFRDVVILTERHSRLERDNRGRLHNPHGMAVQYPDGWGIYAWHGVRVPEAIIVNPITVQQIREERNAEIRRVLLERYGADRFVTDSGALPVHADECGTLYRVTLDNDEPLVLVRLVNSTPEPTRERGLIQAPDGTWRKQYWLRVPPDVQTGREAVAWTFGLKPDDYWPAVET